MLYLQYRYVHDVELQYLGLLCCSYW